METFVTRTVRTLIFGLAALAWSGGPDANAQVVFQQAPDFSFGAFLDDSTATGPDATIRADNFTLTQDRQIGRMRFWGFYANQFDGTFSGVPDDNFTISFYDDNGGVPESSPFATAVIANLIRTLDVIHNGVNVYFVEFATPILVPAGTTWISVANAVSGPNSSNKFWWEASDVPGTHAYSNPHGSSTDWVKSGTGIGPVAIPDKNLALS